MASTPRLFAAVTMSKHASIGSASRSNVVVTNASACARSLDHQGPRLAGVPLGAGRDVLCAIACSSRLLARRDGGFTSVPPVARFECLTQRVPVSLQHAPCVFRSQHIGHQVFPAQPAADVVDVEIAQM